jgi:TolA-binding protein
MNTAKRNVRTFLAALTLACIGLAATPASAQSKDDETRLKTIEAQIRALQRKVFPDGAGRTFAPEVETPSTGTATAAPAATAVTDMLGRLDSIEAQLARLTAQTEENANMLAQLDARLKPFEEEREARLAAEAKARADAEAAAAQQAAAQQAAAQPPAAAPAKPVPPTPERLAAVQKIVKPKTDDAGDDEYTYGFRLWEAGFFPEAEQQLRLYVDKYPDHPRLSFGRNLLGRAFLDDGKPGDAAPWLLKNYQSDKQGARAADSLLYLSEAMIAMKDTKRACIALAEFGETYPALAIGRLKDQYQADRAKVTCN